jgi:hypothetical protein
MGPPFSGPIVGSQSVARHYFNTTLPRCGGNTSNVLTILDVNVMQDYCWTAPEFYPGNKTFGINVAT